MTSYIFPSLTKIEGIMDPYILNHAEYIQDAE